MRAKGEVRRKARQKGMVCAETQQRAGHRELAVQTAVGRRCGSGGRDEASAAPSKSPQSVSCLLLASLPSLCR